MTQFMGSTVWSKPNPLQSKGEIFGSLDKKEEERIDKFLHFNIIVCYLGLQNTIVLINLGVVWLEHVIYPTIYME